MDTSHALHLIRRLVIAACLGREACIALGQFTSRLVSEGRNSVGDPIIIGTTLPIDCCSANSAKGRIMQRAYELYMTWLAANRSGVYIHGPDMAPRPLELIIVDDSSERSKVTKGYEKLLHDMGSKLFLATYGSTGADWAAAVVNLTDAVMVAPVAGDSHWPRVFGVTAPTISKYHGLVNVLKGRAKTVAIVADSNAPENDAKAIDSFIKEARENNMHINHMFITSETDVDSKGNEPVRTTLRKALEMFAKNPPDIFVTVGLSGSGCLEVVKYMMDLDFMPNAAMLDGCVVPPSVYGEINASLGDDAVRFMVDSTRWLQTSRQQCEITGLQGFELAQMYEDRYHSKANYYVAQSWASISVLVYAIERAQSVDPGAIAAVLRSLKVDTIAGSLSFDDNGQGTIPWQLVQVMDHGASVNVFYPPGTGADLIYPAPAWSERPCLNPLADITKGYDQNGDCVECNTDFVAIWVGNKRVCEQCSPGKHARYNQTVGECELIIPTCQIGETGVNCEACARHFGGDCDDKKCNCQLCGVTAYSFFYDQLQEYHRGGCSLNPFAVFSCIVVLLCVGTTLGLCRQWVVQRQVRHRQRKLAEHTRHRRRKLVELKQRMEIVLWLQDEESLLEIQEELCLYQSSEEIGVSLAELRKQHSEHAGVSVSYLLSELFADTARRRTKNPDPTFNEMKFKFWFEIVDNPQELAEDELPIGWNIKCPRDNRLGCSLVDTLSAQDRRPCTHFLSWTWGYKLSTVHSALRMWVDMDSLDPTKLFLYMCFFANNQFRVILQGRAVGELESDFESNLLRIGRVVALLDDWDEPEYLTRIWTIFEQYTALKLDIPRRMILPKESFDSLVHVISTGHSGIMAVKQSLSKIDSAKAEAWRPEDGEKIKTAIRESVGFERVDASVERAMVKWVGGVVADALSAIVVDEAEVEDATRNLTKTNTATLYVL